MFFLNRRSAQTDSRGRDLPARAWRTAAAGGPHHGAAAFVARRRPLIAAAGLAALTAFLVSYFVG
jgi:hypothetical protein